MWLLEGMGPLCFTYFMYPVQSTLNQCQAIPCCLYNFVRAPATTQKQCEAMPPREEKVYQFPFAHLVIMQLLSYN